MKNPPTLADAFVAFSMRPKLNPSLAKACRAMLPARKFVIDVSVAPRSKFSGDILNVCRSGCLGLTAGYGQNGSLELPPLLDYDPRRSDRILNFKWLRSPTELGGRQEALGMERCGADALRLQEHCRAVDPKRGGFA